MAKCRKALRSRRVENGMGKEAEYCRFHFGQVRKIYRHNTLEFGLGRETRRIVTNIIAQSDGTGAVADVLMAWI